jgi:hypothetical protein
MPASVTAVEKFSYRLSILHCWLHCFFWWTHPFVSIEGFSTLFLVIMECRAEALNERFRKGPSLGTGGVWGLSKPFLRYRPAPHFVDWGKHHLIAPSHLDDLTKGHIFSLPIYQCRKLDRLILR